MLGDLNSADTPIEHVSVFGPAIGLDGDPVGEFGLFPRVAGDQIGL